MPEQKKSSINMDFYAPTFVVEVNGQKLAMDISNAIISVSVSEQTEKASTFSLQVDNHELKWQDHSLFKLGNKVTIKMGYVNNLHSIIFGKINGIQVNYPAGGAPTLSVRGIDLLDEFIKKSPEETLSLDNISYSDVVKQIAGKVGVDCKVDATSGKQKKVVISKNITYYKFLNELAPRLNYMFYVRDQKLYFVKQKIDKELATLTWGKSLISFNTQLSLQKQATKVEVRCQNPQTNETIIGRASASDVEKVESGGKTGSELMSGLGMSRTITINNRPVFSQQDADDMAKAELKRANSKLVQGNGSCIGIPDLVPNGYLVLDNLGKRFSGKYKITSTTHSLSSSGYTTNFVVERNSNNEPS